VSQYVASLIVDDKDEAHTLAAALQDLIEPAPDALTLFEHGPPIGDLAAPAGVADVKAIVRWKIDAYYDHAPDAAALRKELAEITALDVPVISVDPVPDNNWVAMSQAALPPVTAGRFVIHGSHDNDRVPQGPNSIMIDAGEAFGTAHHATTSGCLAAIDRVTRTRRYTNVLDLGCGSGVLAIAVARVLPKALILASDLDEPSVAVAAENMRLNGVANRIHVFAAVGLEHPFIRQAGRFDLLIANILANPLIMLSKSIAQAVEPGGTVLLSGLLIPQAPQVIAAYRASGFQLVRHDRVYGWSTLELKRLG
jgi:ribosomal protein L11 methyltransferase